MKKLLLILMTLGCFSCQKVAFDLNNPDVETFVQQIKNGTYNQYKKGDKGENLWLLMPKFTKDHIQSLIDFSKDTASINNFPLNPISSGKPFPYDRQYIILGECLLWTVEGIRNGREYGSLNPVLLDTTLANNFKGLKGVDVLKAQDLYQIWWRTYANSDWQQQNPLKNAPYKWF
jgi:hypothetical protein